MKTPPAGRWSGRLALCALASLGACEVPAYRGDPLRGPREPELAAAPAPAAAPLAAPLPTVRRASGTVHVRLALPADARQVEIVSPWLGRVVLRADGAGVRTPRGQVLEEVWMIPPRPDAREEGGWSLGERVYPGRLRVRAGGGGQLEVVNVVDLEEYVAGVVAAELALWSAEPAELEAQAIAARSYAVAALDERARRTSEALLRDDVADQAYHGSFALAARGASRGEPARKLALALERTRGLVLLEGPRVVDARFHASCGGRTAAGEDVFRSLRFATLASVPCAPCEQARATGGWSHTASPEVLARVARELTLGERLERVRPLRTDGAGRWLDVELTGPGGTRTLPFEELRRSLGREKVASSAIARSWPRPGEPITGGLLLAGFGRGHGVGLCQTGTRGYARQGWSRERILLHYYPGARIADWS